MKYKELNEKVQEIVIECVNDWEMELTDTEKKYT